MSGLRARIGSLLPSPLKRVAVGLISRALAARRFTGCLANKYLRLGSLIRRTGRLHIGCGSKRLDGFLNLDSRLTPATDVVCDCSRLGIFPSGSFSLVYANAFLEHLYADQREGCLREVRRALAPGGIALFTGIPDFRRVAEAYLGGEPGILSDRFDLDHAYRYTHGAPETVDGWWLGQLHKSLFDEEAVAELLGSAGFGAFTVFRYSFRDEGIPLNLGFAARGEAAGEAMTRERLAELVAGCTPDPDCGSIEILRAGPS